MRDRIGRDAADVVYRFGPFSLFPRRQLLLRNERPVKLGGAAFELLLLLVQRPGELVSKNELVVSAWGRAAVHDANLKVNIFSLRRALGDTQTPPNYIATVPRRGYRFVAPVTVDTIDLTVAPGDEGPGQPGPLPPPGDIGDRYRLLSQDEATLLRRISVFADAFELEDVVTVAAAATLDGTAIAVALGGLVAKSLLVAETTGTELRYRLHDSTRRYAAERLREDPLDAMAQYAYALRILTLFEQSANGREWRSAADWLTRYRRRLSDLRKVLTWAFGPATQIWLGIRLTVAAIPIWFELSAISEGSVRVELALEKSRIISCDPILQVKLADFRAWSLNHAQKLLPETQRAWLTAIELARFSSEVEYQLQGLVGLASYLVQIGHQQEALACLDQFRKLAESHDEWSAAPEADCLRALAQAYRGDLATGRKILEGLARAYPKVDRRARATGFTVEPFIEIRNHLPFVTWLTGQPDYAAQTAREAVEAAGRVGHILSQSNALVLAAIPVSHWNGDAAALESYTTQLHSSLEIERIPLWSPIARFYEAVVRDLGGETDAVGEMRQSIEQLLDSRRVARIGLYFGILAEALLNQNRVSEANEVITLALQYGERWCQPELHRILAAILRRTGDPSEAQSLLHRAQAEAHAMRAVSFELRIAFDLASAHVEAGRGDEAVRVLAPVYNSFSEGFGTRDLVMASRLLADAKVL